MVGSSAHCWTVAVGGGDRVISDSKNVAMQLLSKFSLLHGKFDERQQHWLPSAAVDTNR